MTGAVVVAAAALCVLGWWFRLCTTTFKETGVAFGTHVRVEIRIKVRMKNKLTDREDEKIL